MCTSHNIYWIQSKAMYLAMALNIALQQMPLKTWASCCNDAVSRVEEFHQQLCENSNNNLATKNGGTVQRWFRMWKQNSGCFPNPHYVCNKKKVLPQLLENYPVLHNNLVKEIDNNLAHLSGEYVFTKLSLPTIYRWMHALGFKYDERKKCYYVYNHKSEANVTYRRGFFKSILQL